MAQPEKQRRAKNPDKPANNMGSARTRERILIAAKALFAEKGFEATSTQEIADHAGVNKRLIFYYFESKEELYLAALEDFFRGVEALLQNFCITSADLQDPWLSLLRFSDNFIEYVSRSQEPIKILVREIMDDGKFLDKLNREYIKPILEAGEGYLSQLLVAGSDANHEVRHLLLSFGGANIFYFLLSPLLEKTWNVDATSKEHLEERKKEMRRFILRSL